MPTSTTRRVCPWPLLYIMLGTSLFQVLLVLWVTWPDGWLLTGIGILVGLAVGRAHWRYTARQLDGDVVRDVVSVFRLDVVVPGLLLLSFSACLLLISLESAIPILVGYIGLPFAVALLLYLFVMIFAAKKSNEEQSPSPPADSASLLSLYVDLVVSLVIESSLFKDLFAEMEQEQGPPAPAGVIAFLVMYTFIFSLIVLPVAGLLPNGVPSSYAVIGAWVLAYATRFWLYERRNGPLFFVWQAREQVQPVTVSSTSETSAVHRPGFKAKYKTMPHAAQPAEAGAASRQSPPATLDLTPYAGRWVALLHGEVAGVGATAADARLAARLQWGEDEPAVVRVPGLSVTENEA